MNLPQNPSKSTIARNPELYPIAVNRDDEGRVVSMSIGVIRQSRKPKLNQTEQQFSAWLHALCPDAFIVEQDITFRIANGSRFTPDAVVFHPLIGTIDAYEVKPERRHDSRWLTDDSRLKLILAAKTFPFIRWHLAYKQNGNWVTQQILP